MSRSRKKSARLQTSIKYELYGIVILTLSVIALSQSGSFARSLNYLFRFLIGHWDFVIPVYFIYMGLYVMMKREWPKFWTRRKTGLLVFLLGLVIMSHISLFNRLDPLGNFTGSHIIRQTWINMIEALPTNPQGAEYLSGNVGGGMIGALLYGLLYFLFDNLGARLIQITLFIIGFVLITGISLVDVGSNFGKRVRRLQSGLDHRISEWSAKRKLDRQRLQEEDGVNDSGLPEEDKDEEVYIPVISDDRPNAKKKPLFFQLLRPSKERGTANADAEEARADGKRGDPRSGNGPSNTDMASWHGDSAEEKTKDQTIPLIRDFQDHLRDDAAFPLPLQAETKENQAALPAGPGPVSEESDDWDGELSSLPENGMGTDKPQREKPAYQLPPFHLLSKPANHGKNGENPNHKANARKLETTLESFGVRAKVLEVVHGPAVTRYEIQPDVGVKVSRIVSLTDDIALALAAKDIRIEAPIPGKSAIGIEVPNTEVAVVTLREVMESPAFLDSPSKLTITLGRDISGKPIVGNLAKMPHLLVAGATGSGKSVCINGIITSILFKAKPDEVKFLMIDPKMVELNVYNGIPHLLAPVVTDPKRASLALKKIVAEMEKRYEWFAKSGTRNIDGYNALALEKNEEPLPYIVVIVDELADLMMVAANDVEDSICRLAQMARAAGIHLIIATQRPSVDVITGLIKANIPSRIAFGVSSQVDSRTILDMAGAEKLLGRGDMLYLPVGASKPVRVQGAFLSEREVEAVVHFVSSQGKADYREELVPEVEQTGETEEEYTDELYDQAVHIVLEAKQASVSLLQRRLRIGYTRAARLIDAMEAKGVVGPYEGSKPREVRLTLEQYQQNQISS